MMSIAFRVIAAFVVVGISLGDSNAEPKELFQPDVEDCRFIANVKGSSGYGKDMNWRHAAKVRALKKAEGISATHVVWKSFKELGVLNGVADGAAYRCD
ncbi:MULTISPECIES: hypothetical protein [Methylocaldum]|jgi:hypothetical protein|uniref:hypothetical protein n=1 Tax=unclassified Methylocaldum TaxID=2622260 RepID=UPI000A32A6EC|nr:hypothetical protein [Methylocaldum sp. RMAD-M]MBP1151190.1 hypothetical protein [Methylocaldum sp. RMAD-M]MVF21840.1 hypothetical protein [Methylocaldum sp. BRCS4]